MFNTLTNSARIDFTLVPAGPLLVRASTSGLDPALADQEFQRTWHQGRSTVYLPGSGLKGALRSHCERLLRAAGRFACDPTSRGQDACHQRTLPPAGTATDPDHPHANQCPACFTFGSLQLAGRFRAADAYPPEELWEATNRTEVRTGVGLDRRTQAPVPGALFDLEAVVDGGFRASLGGESFSLWQLGLVLAALADLDAGLLQLGGGKSRGMGTVRVRDAAIELRFLDRAQGQLCGARRHALDAHDYGLPENDVLPAGDGAEEGQSGLFRTVGYRGDAVAGLGERLASGPLARYLGLGGGA